MNKTLYFQNCLGVFQGGGCKGAAYVGAYSAASEKGVSFSELVGTSAGSIIAVLIGAGATPEQLKSIMEDLNFNNFLIPPDKNIGQKKDAGFYIQKLLPKSIKTFTELYYNYGFYNSSGLKTWIEKKLEFVLGATNPNIKFKDLLIPTSVVVTNIQTKKVEIFSTHATPDKLVSEAVQRSCNIPFFFQPINEKYVDGGLLSNLPTFIFQNSESKIYNKVLAFCLKESHKNKPINSFIDYGKLIMDTTLDGNLDIQLSLQTDLHIIEINTGDISATDFSKINEKITKFLIEEGEKAVNNFFLNERANVRSSATVKHVAFDSFETNNFIIDSINSKSHEILIFDTNNRWVYDLFPTLLKWHRDGALIKVIGKIPKDDDYGSLHRYRILESLGIKIKYVTNLPFSAFVFDEEELSSCRAVVINNSEEPNKNYHSKLYFGEKDSIIIGLLKEKFNSIYDEKDTSYNMVVAEAANHSELISLLKVIKAYSPDEVQMTIESIDISKVVFLTKFIRGDKYRQIHCLVDLYTRHGLPLFSPIKIIYPNKKYTLVTPPVVEKIGDGYYLIEGNTRLTYALRNKIKEINCVVVRNVTATLPSLGRFTSRHVLITDKFKEGVTRYENFNHDSYRPIEQTVRNPRTSLK